MLWGYCDIVCAPSVGLTSQQLIISGYSRTNYKRACDTNTASLTQHKQLSRQTHRSYFCFVALVIGQPCTQLQQWPPTHQPPKRGTTSPATATGAQLLSHNCRPNSATPPYRHKRLGLSLFCSSLAPFCTSHIQSALRSFKRVQQQLSLRVVSTWPRLTHCRHTLSVAYV